MNTGTTYQYLNRKNYATEKHMHQSIRSNLQALAIYNISLVFSLLEAYSYGAFH
jgi:hypothetical protein